MIGHWVQALLKKVFSIPVSRNNLTPEMETERIKKRHAQILDMATANDFCARALRSLRRK